MTTSSWAPTALVLDFGQHHAARQLSSQVAGASPYLFAPQLTYRIRRNNNTDTLYRPKNPPDKTRQMERD